MDLNTEKRHMQQTLQTALSQLKSQDDVVDRILLSNLLVSYFQRRKSRDILELIAKVLNFSDEQKEAVGLKVPPNNLISTLFSFAAGAGPSSSGNGTNESLSSSPEALKGILTLLGMFSFLCIHPTTPSTVIELSNILLLHPATIHCLPLTPSITFPTLRRRQSGGIMGIFFIARV